MSLETKNVFVVYLKVYLKSDLDLISQLIFKHFNKLKSFSEQFRYYIRCTFTINFYTKNVYCSIRSVTFFDPNKVLGLSLIKAG